MSYGPNFSDLFRRAADFVDKILRGAKPADIPVEQPTKFDLVINLNTAKALGLDSAADAARPRRRGDRMRRREFITLLGGAAAAWPYAARAQQPATQHRIAIFHPAIPTTLLTETGGGSAWRAFFAELRRLGYVEGENLIIERYSAEGHHERYADLAREIVTRNPDLIVTGTNPVVIVFKAATSTIPVVAFMLDPLKAGLVTSLARPGGNLTGITLDAGIEIWGKRLEMLKEADPFDSQGRISGYARGVGRFFWASLAGCRRPVGNFVGFYAPAAGDSLGDRARLRCDGAATAGRSVGQRGRRPLRSPPADRRTRREAPLADDVSIPRLRRGRWTDGLYRRSRGAAQAHGR